MEKRDKKGRFLFLKGGHKNSSNPLKQPWSQNAFQNAWSHYFVALPWYKNMELMQGSSDFYVGSIQTHHQIITYVATDSTSQSMDLSLCGATVTQ